MKKGSFLQGSKRDVRGQGEARPRLESSLSDPRNHILHLLLLLHAKALEEEHAFKLPPLPRESK